MALQTAFILHRRPYREHSQIVELFGSLSGRVAAVVRIPKSRRSAQAPCEPFLPVLTEWLGRGELKTVKSFEAAGQPIPLKGQALYAGFYLNELLLRLLGKEEPQSPLFYLYEATLEALAASADLEPVLRQFELGLLGQLGYGIDLRADHQGLALLTDHGYRFVSDQGWLPTDAVSDRNCFYGRQILAIAEQTWSDQDTRSAAKRLCRLALAPLLGDKPLRSRELFRQHGAKQS